MAVLDGLLFERAQLIEVGCHDQERDDDALGSDATDAPSSRVPEIGSGTVFEDTVRAFDGIAQRAVRPPPFPRSVVQELFDFRSNLGWKRHGMFQAVPWPEPEGDERVRRSARWIVTRLLHHKYTQARATEAVVTRLEHAESYGQANLLARTLVESECPVTATQLTRLREAQATNRQVQNAWDVETALSSIEQRTEKFRSTPREPSIPAEPAEGPF